MGVYLDIVKYLSSNINNLELKYVSLSPPHLDFITVNRQIYAPLIPRIICNIIKLYDLTERTIEKM